MPRRSVSTPSIEIVLDRNPAVFLLRGSRDESPSVAVRGHAIVSTPDSMTLRRLTLRLVGALKIRWHEPLPTRSSSATQFPIRYEKVVYEQEFEDLDLTSIASSGSRTPMSGRTTPVASMTNLASYFAGGPSTGSGTSTPTGGSQHIKAGEHLVPFEIIVPGRVHETVEGNHNVQLTYTLLATAERGRFHSALNTKKHLRFVRTLGVDTYDAAHTVSVNNTWPDKVEYSIILASKSVAIGSRVDVQFEFQPLLKGLRLGTVQIQIIEMLQLAPPNHQAFNEERTVFEKMFDLNRPEFQAPDGWDFKLSMKVPASLAICSQDCAVHPHFKITHKMRVFVGLKNPDGHTSELRASLPMQLYISPSIRIATGHLPGAARPSASVHQASAQPEPARAEMLFSTPQETSEDAGTAPPNYSEHVFDQIWSDMPTPLSLSPSQSGFHTPFSPPPVRTLPGLDPAQTAQLQAGLRALALSRNEPTPQGTTSVDIAILSRVPSYDSALNTPAQTLTESAPRYEG